MPTPYDSAASVAQQDAAHPFVAGLTYHHQWSVPAGMPAHSCIFAFVISEHEPLRDRFGNVLLSWMQANAATFNFGTWASLRTSDEFSFLVTDNLQFIQRNIDILPLPPNFFARFSLPPMVFERGGFGDDFEPFYVITTENLQGNARLFIETFNGEEQELVLEDGRIEFNAAGTALRAGIYGMAFSVQLEEGTVLEDNIVIEYRTRYGEDMLDGYRFEIRNGDEAEFTQKTIETSLFALNAYIDLFGDEVVAQMRDTIEGFDSQGFADLLNWLRSDDAYTRFESLYADVQEKAPADMAIVAQLASFIANLGSASDEQLLLDFKTVFDRLHLLLMLNNGIIGGSGFSASEMQAEAPLPPVESAKTTESQGCLQALLDFIRKLFS
jgi:hypothetical protein